jgi:3-mercaptopyruvate sulfurtransferase SseA
MRKILLTAVIVNGAALALLVAACKAPDGAETARGGANAAASPGAAKTAAGPNVAAPVQPPADIVRRVTVAEFKAMADRGEAVAVDVRTKEQFDGGHIKGALSLPRPELAKRAGELPKDKLIVFYCA